VDLQRTLDPKYEGISFGAGDPQKFASELEWLAGEIRSGRVVLNQTRLIQVAKQDDFYVQSLIIRFYEKYRTPQDPPIIPG